MAELEAGPVGRSLVVIVNDRTAHGDQDTSGPLVTELLAEAGFVVDGVVVVENDLSEIQNAVNTAVIGGVDLVVTVGGTGVTPRDVAPEATQPLLDRELLGIAVPLRSRCVRSDGCGLGHLRGHPGVGLPGWLPVVVGCGFELQLHDAQHLDSLRYSERVRR
ncbi:molybdopterin-binding protein [Mycobacteroides abscessus subsp. massiliense]|nr:molybdopterin-binding protein [Mycobacteroides abscessus]MDO3317976.1 molybdopterin-binding protein [Mycobacteroides abscessus subsp. massiliense]